MKRFLSSLLGARPKPQRGPAKSRPVIDPNAYGVVYAVGDVHGCVTELKALEARIVEDAASRPGRKLIVMLGDYVDRGPHSAQVLDHLIAPPSKGFDRISLCGNHDELFLQYLLDPWTNDGWVTRMGGDDALISYGIDARHVLEIGGLAALAEVVEAEVPAAHLEFLRQLSSCVRIGDVVFAHAGLRPGIAIEAQDEQDLIWIREPFLTEGPRLPVVVVHGHTPASKPVWGTGRLGIDTACYSTGVLTAARVIDGQIEIL
jgi:serine/threonine protein phosphatase 1